MDKENVTTGRNSSSVGFYRTIIRDEKSNRPELIVWQSRDFGVCMEEARKLISVGISANQIDILSLSDDGSWESIWSDGGDL